MFFSIVLHIYGLMVSFVVNDVRCEGGSGIRCNEALGNHTALHLEVGLTSALSNSSLQ